MKILHLIASAHPSTGGPIEGIRQLAIFNQAYGHQIEVASLDAPNAEFIKHFPLPIHPLGPGLLKYGYTSRLVPWLRANARNFDVLIVDGVWQYHSFGVWLALHATDTPYVLFTHGMLDPWFKRTYPLKHLKKMLYWPWAEYRVLRDAGAVLFTCQEERRLARQSFRPYHCNGVVVNFGTAGPDGNPETELVTFFESFPDLRGKRLATFLGRIHEKKGCDLLIQAFAKVLASDPDWQLVICGPDRFGLRATLQAMAKPLNISNQITWAGSVSGELKWGALRASEVFVLPSHQENFGIVVAEALACGLPALISNQVNIWHEVEQDGAGIVATDDLKGTCTMLKTWLEMSSQQKSDMQKNARECFLRRFEIHHAANTLIDVLTKVVAKRDAQSHA